MRFLSVSCLVVLVVMLSGCGAEKRAAKEARRNELRALMHGLTPDAEMTAAMEKGQATVGDFLAVIKSPGPNQKQFLVRKKFPALEGGQQILWVNNVTFDGTLLHGKVDDNTLKQGSGISTNGMVSFPPAEVCDWMFNEDGKAVGGYTIRALQSKMTTEEWAAMERQIQFK